METIPSYVIVSPVKNEARNIEHTIRSVVAQSVLPIAWVIVDDGSTDATAEIVGTSCCKYSWISFLRHRKAGPYDLSSGSEIRAFCYGYNTIRHLTFKFLAKLDGDISFTGDYFEQLLRRFMSNDKLGIASGIVQNYDPKSADSGSVERVYKFHVRGAARVYRRECWDQMGGTYEQLGWDSLDVYKARMLGWETRSYDEIRMTHHVKSWTKVGVLRGMARSGRAHYLIGSHPVFFMAKVVAALFQWPWILKGIALATGYISSTLKGATRLGDDAVRAFVRREQMRRIW
jgi:biofilm PGA synthesis N-glycosyltransferase PgaC